MYKSGLFLKWVFKKFWSNFMESFQKVWVSKDGFGQTGLVKPIIECDFIRKYFFYIQF